MRTSISLLALLVLAASACGEARTAHEVERGDDGIGCDLCHGAGPTGAPPPSLSDRTDSSDPRVGAHRAHLDQGVACASCHVVPTSISSPGHIDEARASVPFGGVAKANGAQPSYDRSSGACSATWCHGRPGGATPAPRWNVALEGDRCARCHGLPPPRPHSPWSACTACHRETIPAAGPIVTATHVNGIVDATRVHPEGWVAPTAHGAAARAGATGCSTSECHGPALLDPASRLSCAACHGGPDACASCHGAPPTSGAHARHYTESRGEVRAAYGDLRTLADFEPQGAAGYQFGCGHCHPLDPARHLDGQLDVDLSPAGVPAGTLKARNGTGATYVKATGQPAGTCADVYCHSSGQQAPAFAATPRWDGVGRIGCDGCHANPPRYGSGGAGSATANSHVQSFVEAGAQILWGHFGGVGSHNLLANRASFPETASRHGAHSVPGCATTQLGCEDAAPITCESCHAGTVDRGARSYYLDTTSDFSLPGVAMDERQCSSCHGAPNNRAPAAAGAVRPLLHVNGRRDVGFDPLTAAPAPFPSYSPVPSGAYLPTLRSWMSGVSPNFAPPRDAALNGPLDPAGRTTISFHLANATYDAGTKTCSNVGCHVRQTSVRWGAPFSALNCVSCH